MSVTTRLALPYPELTDGPDGANVPHWMKALALKLDAAALDDQGTLVNRPESSPGTPGIRGRYYMVAGDGTAANNGILWRDNGIGWDQVGRLDHGTIADDLGDRPPGAAALNGLRFWATDQHAEYLCIAAAWVRIGAQAGEGGFTMAAAATPGKILLQGQAWPSTVGIYADLYAALGNPATVPDFQLRVPVGRKAGDADFGTLLALLGEKTHDLAVSEIPDHDHPFREDAGNGGAIAKTVGTIGPGRFANWVAGIVGGTGGGDPHNNIQPSIVVNYEAKL